MGQILHYVGSTSPQSWTNQLRGLAESYLGNRNPDTLENLSIHEKRNTVVIMDLSVTKG